jgi:periplasmic divalent cation tolerance protein
MPQESSMPPDVAWPTEQVVAEICTTFTARPAAVACGARLIEQRLAACVQIDGPFTSIYCWQGGVETSEEFGCRVKTTPAAVAACESAIQSMHPYVCPEILVTYSCGSAAYAAWVREQVLAPPEPSE